MKAGKKGRRNSHGNIFAMICLSTGFFVIMSMVAMAFVSVVFVNNHLQATADSLAMYGAAHLNVHDRAGQMNNMVARCRELVFDSMQMHKAANNQFPQLNTFAYELLDEAKIDSQDLERERMHLKDIMHTEAAEAMRSACNERMEGLEITLPWLKMKDPQFRFKFGDAGAGNSNVQEDQGIPELSSFDVGNGNLTAVSRHFKGHINAMLPEQDSNLSFHISSLPAPATNGHAAMPHLTSSDKFVEFGSEDSQLPSSCHVELDVNVSGNGLPGTSQSVMKVNSTSITAGGLPAIED